MNRMGIDVERVINRIKDSGKEAEVTLTSQVCHPLATAVPGSSVSFNTADLQLDLTIPQLEMQKFARGYVDPSRWDQGINAGIVQYNLSTYTSGGQGANFNSAFLGLQSGINVGGWRLRQWSSANWQNRGGGTHWQSIALYAQHDITALKGQVTIGDSSTSGDVFDTFNVRGVQLSSDDRMLPDNVRSYAPVVRGVADTNARVTVRQNGLILYETTVSPGPFELSDVPPTGYQEAHTVSGLKGAPPGYVGYGEGGVLTEAVRRRPYSVVLLDEVEKAHRDVHEMFFQVFDKGYMEDGDGRYIDFRNTTILLTSNVGSDLTASLCADEELAPDLEGLRTALTPELLKAFPAAFLGRVSVVPYLPLAQQSLARIVRLHLDRVVKRMAEQQEVELTYDSRVVDYIVGRCLVQETGARVLIGFIEQHVLPRLAALWLDAMSSKLSFKRVSIDVADESAAPAAALVFRAEQ